MQPPESLTAMAGGKGIAEVTVMSHDELGEYFDQFRDKRKAKREKWLQQPITVHRFQC